MRLLRRAASLLLASALVLLLAPATAHADPLATVNIKTPTLAIGIASIPDGIRVCFTGSGHVVAPWSAQLAGTRTSPNPLLVPVAYSFFSPGAVAVSECFDVMKHGTPAGEAGFRFESLGGNSTTATDRPAALHGVVAWAVGRPDAWVVTSGG